MIIIKASLTSVSYHEDNIVGYGASTFDQALHANILIRIVLHIPKHLETK